jgi:hypothetical protein
MKTALFALIMALFPGAVIAQQKPLAEYSWQALAAAGKLKTGTVVTLPDKSVALKIENTGQQPLMATVLIVDQPKITGKFYTLSGDVRYDAVEGDGYLEMWNHFGESEAYFSRTMGETGPMGKLRGTSDWRPFILPFNATGTKSNPTKLVVNVHLPAKGVVYLRSPLKLAESSSAPGGASAQPGAWWSDRAGGLIGGIIGSVGGCLGALIGWLSARGKARGFVLGSTLALTGFGAIAIIVGLLAVTWQQPYAVWYPLLLVGVLLVVICPVILRSCLHRYREVELRRMTSMDVA